MKKILHLILLAFLTVSILISCNDAQNKTDEKNNETVNDNDNQTESNKNDEIIDAEFVLLETDFGNVKIKLYDETPKHKANFLKLANNNFFDNLLFHRVIKDFMIQGGDPESKNAAPDAMLGNGGPGYQIDAEFNDSLFHKKGVIAAAREGDQINPLKKSSGSQFYIVQGKKYTDEELDYMEEQNSINKYIMTHSEVLIELDSIQHTQDKNAINTFFEKIKKKDDFNLIKIPEFKRKAYKETGGTPFLDNSYTVFGEVVEGLDVIDKIASVETKQGDRPVKDVKMKISVIKK